MANPIVTFEMENGDIMKAELYPEIAPNTVNNFISLINKGFYDGLLFKRTIAVICCGFCDLIYNIHSFRDLSKRRISAVQMR